MKIRISIIAAVLFATSSLFAMEMNSNVMEKVIGINNAFVPGGFSSDSDAYVVVSGQFINGCYSWNRAETAVNQDDKAIEVKSIANVVQNQMCIMAMIPFSEKVSLGKLPTGQHTVRFVGDDGTGMEKIITIE